MRCSKCSEQVKPVVAIDIDGTLGDYHGHFLRFAEAFLGETTWRQVPDVRPYDGSEPMREWFCRVYRTDVSTFRAIKLAYRQGGMKRTMPVYAEAARFTWALSRRAEVWLTTTRPWQRYDRIDPDTHEWLRRNGIRWDAVLYDEDKYRVLSERVDPERVVGVVDDEPEQYDRAQEVFDGGVPILRCNQYNRAVKRPVMAGDLLAIAEMIDGNCERWERQHAEAR